MAEPSTTAVSGNEFPRGATTAGYLDQVGHRDRRGELVPGSSTPRAAEPGATDQTARRGATLKGLGILIVDDQVMHREFLADVVTKHGAPIAAVAGDTHSLTAACNVISPNVIVVNMMSRNNTSLLQHALTYGGGDVGVVVTGLAEDDEAAVIECAEAGVAGYHTRSETLDALLQSIVRVANGESSCSPTVAAILLRRLATIGETRATPQADTRLTARESEILALLERGLSNREIAAELCIAVHTVKNHVHGLLTKLGVTTRAQAAAVARSLRQGDRVTSIA